MNGKYPVFMLPGTEFQSSAAFTENADWLYTYICIQIYIK